MESGYILLDVILGLIIFLIIRLFFIEYKIKHSKGKKRRYWSRKWFVFLLCAFSIFLLFFSSMGQSLVLNIFNNSLGAENLTFAINTSNYSILRYINLPVGANVSQLYINLTGLMYTNDSFEQNLNGWDTGNNVYGNNAGGGSNTLSFVDSSVLAPIDGSYSLEIASDTNCNSSQTGKAFIEKNFSTSGIISINAWKQPQNLNVLEILFNGDNRQNVTPSAAWNNYNFSISAGDNFRLYNYHITNNCGASGQIKIWFDYFTYYSSNNSKMYDFNPNLKVGTPYTSIYQYSLRNMTLQGQNALLTILNDSNSIENLTFTGNQNLTLGLKIPKNAIINTSALNISGYNGTLEINSFETSNDGWDINNLTIARNNTAWTSNGLWSLYFANQPITNIPRKYNVNFSNYQYMIFDYNISNYDTKSEVRIEMDNILNKIYGFPSSGNSTNYDIVINLSSFGSGLHKIQFDTNLCVSNCATGPFNYLVVDNIRFSSTQNLTNPLSPFLQVGNLSSGNIWNYSGNFSGINNRTLDFSPQLQTYLNTCVNDSENYCNVPLLFGSQSAGILQISDILINMTNISQTLNLASQANLALNNSCSGGTLIGNNCTIPLLFSSSNGGILQYSNINITYTTTPNVSNNAPINNTVEGAGQTNFTCNTTDSTPLANSTFKLYNSALTLVNTNVTNITGTSNLSTTSYNFTLSDTYYWACSAMNNNSIQSSSLSNYTLIVDVSNPIVNQLFPLNNKYINYSNNININCSVSGSNLAAVFLYSNFTGTYGLNQTINGITSGNTNTFIQNLSDNGYSYTCNINKSISNTLIPGQQGNYSFFVDTKPSNITFVYFNTTANSQTINFLTNSVDPNGDANTCTYAIYNSLGNVDGLNNNVTYTCNTNVQATVSAFATYTAVSSVLDAAGNLNWTSLSFTTSQSSGSSGGGGGGNNPASNLIPVIGIQDINASNVTYTPLYREIIFAAINNGCSIKIRGTSLAVSDYSTQCNLNNNDLSSVLQTLVNYQVPISSQDLYIFYSNYRRGLFFQGQETKATIDSYNLFTSLLGTTNLLALSPPSVDVPVILFIPSNGTYTISYTIFSNKPLKSCDVTGNSFLFCTISNSTISLSEQVQNLTFFSKIYTGTISVLTDAPQNLIEQKKTTITFRVYNLDYPIIGIPIYFFLIAVPAIIIVLITLYFRGRRKRRISGLIRQLAP